MKLYKWQAECLEKWKENSRVGYIEAVTGSGKTFLAITASRDLKTLFPQTKTIVLVPKIALAQQWKQAFLKYGLAGDSISIRSGKQKESTESEIIIYVINTARYELARLLLSFQQENKHVLIITDEYHHYFSKENSHIFDFVNSNTFQKNLYSYLGISATNNRLIQDVPFKKAIGRLFYKYKLEDAINDKVVSPFAVFNIQVMFTPEESYEYNEITERISKLLRILNYRFPLIKSNYGFQEYLLSIRKIASSDEINIIDSLSNLLFKRRELISNASQRIKCVLEIMKHMKSDSKIIVFCERIEQCDTIYDNLARLFPESVAKYHSSMDEEVRSRHLKAFKRKDKRILITCKALDEGIDIPSSDVGIFLSNTDSELQRIQRLGRLIRKANGKDFADLYYIYVGNSIEFPCLLHNTPSFIHSVLLSYKKGKIENQSYNQALKKALKKMSTDKRLTDKQKKSIYNAAVRGSLHHDYLLDDSELESKINNASSIQDKNYYILAKAVHKYI